MKKIAMLLAMLLCLVPVLSACGAQSSAEGVVEAALQARYEDFDYETLQKIDYKCNKELFTELLDSGEVLDELKKDIEDEREEIKTNLKSYKKTAEAAEDYSVTYEIRYCNVYDEDDDAFDVILKKSEFSEEGFGDVKDAIDQVARVRVIGEIIFENEDGLRMISNIAEIYTCYRIDGDWYIDWENASSDVDSVEVGVDLGDLGSLLG